MSHYPPPATTWITQFYLQITPCLPLLPSRKTSPPFGWYSFYHPTEGRTLSRPGQFMFMVHRPWSVCCHIIVTTVADERFCRTIMMITQKHASDDTRGIIVCETNYRQNKLNITCSAVWHLTDGA